ncbi:AAA family ATPase [Mycobacteroides salmoniphilum]|uniref:AAA family ATPase n=1 Tax=Mycobacteroides salmoniphilum TaxID=404941 RepID=UPI0009932793|nr:AAA family ATPase [Mycobacteroides salmoniphilum]
MGRVLVTGMSGTGKTTLLEELARRGYPTVDTDYDGWTLADGRWDAARMAELLDQRSEVIVSGTVDNQVDFYDRFGHVVLLSVPLEVAIARVSSRTNNPYGRTDTERAAIARYTEEVEPLLRRSATVELDGRLPVAELAERVGALAR